MCKPHLGGGGEDRTMKMSEAMVAWDPDTGGVRVGPWPDRIGWSDSYPMTDGACEARIHAMPPDQQVAQVFILFHALVVRDGIPPDAAHRAFLAIDEFRAHISPDIPGATAQGADSR
jgi:hypothetical protein